MCLLHFPICEGDLQLSQELYFAGYCGFGFPSRIINSHSTQSGLNDFAAKGKFSESQCFSYRHIDISATWLESEDNGDENDENNNRRQCIYFDN